MGGQYFIFFVKINNWTANFNYRCLTKLRNNKRGNKKIFGFWFTISINNAGAQFIWKIYNKFDNFVYGPESRI